MDEDQVLQEAFAEEAVPLVIFNEEKKCKSLIYLLIVVYYSIRTQRRRSTIFDRA